MSIELLLNRFGQSIKFQKKVKISFETSNWWPYIVPNMYFERLPGDVLRMSWERPKSTSIRTYLERQIRTSSGCHFRTSLGRFLHPWDIQTGSSDDVLGTLEVDVFGTYWGPMFAILDSQHKNRRHLARHCKKCRLKLGIKKTIN